MMDEKDFEEPNYDELSDGSGDVKKNNNNNNNQKKAGDGGDGLAQTSKVFVASLSDATTTASLRAYCEGFGFPLQDVIVVERDGKSKGYGFVTFTTPSDAESFVSNKGEPHVIDGKQADAKKSVPKQEHIHRTNMLAAAEAATKLFVGGLPDVTDEDFEKYWSKYGSMMSCKVLRDPTGRCKGFGFVSFDSMASVKKVLSETHAFGDKTVDVKFANRPQQQRNSNSSQMNQFMQPGMPGAYNNMYSSSNNNNDKVRNPAFDWTCPKCNNLNYSFRIECKKCLFPRPAAMAAPPGGNNNAPGMGGMMNNGMVMMHPGMMMMNPGMIMNPGMMMGGGMGMGVVGMNQNNNNNNQQVMNYSQQLDQYNQALQQFQQQFQGQNSRGGGGDFGPSRRNNANQHQQRYRPY